MLVYCPFLLRNTESSRRFAGDESADNGHTNGIQNFWNLLKRTIGGTYVSVERFHLFLYLDE